MEHNGKNTTQENTANNFGIPVGLVSKRRDELILARNSSEQQASEVEDSQESTVKEESTRLTHLTQSRPMIPHHRPPTRHVGQTLFFEENQQNKHGEQVAESDLTVLDEIKKAVALAISRYQDRANHVENARHKPGWFTNWRHGPAGLKNAETINTQVNLCKSMDFAIIELTHFFLDPYRRYENNSLSMYLLDELNAVLSKHSIPECKPEGNTPYDKFTWISISSQLKKLGVENAPVAERTLDLTLSY
ncbi:hypothetical protein [uncultured Legionella sp.]|uniref:hypothetical protein n=1 Tax=uncultured Legionella sp. TaxID=210934 RepID=UPI002612AADC|nr:hypothetical protein [uncultured Legionella sp.]